jgi:hypothetical protein
LLKLSFDFNWKNEAARGTEQRRLQIKQGLRLDSARDTVYESDHQRHLGDELFSFKKISLDIETHLKRSVLEQSYIHDVRVSLHSLQVPFLDALTSNLPTTNNNSESTTPITLDRP